MRSNHILFFLIFLICISCSTNASENTDPHYTTDAEELFFKNLRQSDYELTENKAAGLNIFVHQDQQPTDELRVKLILNWRTDQAFVILEWQKDQEVIKLQSGNEEIVWTGESMSNHHDVALFLFNHQQRGEKIIIDDSSELVLSEAHLLTLKDYLKLTSRR